MRYSFSAFTTLLFNSATSRCKMSTRALTRTCRARRTPHAVQKAQKDTTGTKPTPKWDWSTSERETHDRHARRSAVARRVPEEDGPRRQEFADARRYLSALCSEDNQALHALMAEIHHDGRAMKVLAAMAVQALDFAHLSADRLGGDVQKWLDEAAMAEDTAKTERHQTELGGEG